MQPSGLPQSQNIEDRRGQYMTPDVALAYLLSLVNPSLDLGNDNVGSAYTGQPTGPLSHAAGYDDIGLDFWNAPLSKLPKPR